MRTSSLQCSLAMASDNLIILSSCRTVILHADRDTPTLRDDVITSIT